MPVNKKGKSTLALFIVFNYFRYYQHDDESHCKKTNHNIVNDNTQCKTDKQNHSNKIHGTCPLYFDTCIISNYNSLVNSYFH